MNDIFLHIDMDAFYASVEQVSIDEAFMSISGMEKLLGSPETIGRSIKEHILKATGLTCSIGIAPAKFLAKIASDMDKPDGLFIISPDQVQRVIDGSLSKRPWTILRINLAMGP